MAFDSKDFWRTLQTGTAVAVAGSTSPRLLGVRDAFSRYFREVVGVQPSVAVVPQAVEQKPVGLAVSDQEVVASVHQRVAVLAERLEEEYPFIVAVEGGLHTLTLDEDPPRTFIRAWAAVHCPLGEALGSSGSIELPAGVLARRSGFLAGTRRGGGIISSLTGGQEDRRRATAEATFHALCSVFYEVIEGPGQRRRL
ncbi:MAG: DUF84 family protein [Acidobacteriota bacterium]